MCHASDYAHLGADLPADPPPAPAPVDPLWPAGDRPLCIRCRLRPVYLAGLCGGCYADTEQADQARRRALALRADRGGHLPPRTAGGR